MTRMRLDLLKTTVAQRMLLLFVLCAVLPIGALALLSYRHVTDQLTDQATDRLGQAAKSAGMAVIERLLAAETELSLRTATVVGSPQTTGWTVLDSGARTGGVEAVAHVGAGATRLHGMSRPASSDALDEGELTHLKEGRTILVVEPVPKGPTALFLGRLVDPTSAEAGVVWARVDPAFLWSSALGYAPAAVADALCVLDGDSGPLHCPGPALTALAAGLPQQEQQASRGEMVWSDEGKEYLASYWTAFLMPTFHAPAWTVILSESRATVLAPLAGFAATFRLVVLLSLLTVLILSISQIRRILDPLGSLTRATNRIAERDFATRVDVASGDEFEELGRSFNLMAQRLGAQFNALTTIGALDRAVLAAVDRDTIAHTLLSHLGEVVSCDGVVAGLLSGRESRDGWLYRANGALPMGEPLQLGPGDLETLAASADHLVVRRAGGIPPFLSATSEPWSELAAYVLFPLHVRGAPAGFVGLGYSDDWTRSDDDLHHGRQIADQVAVALSNAWLLSELEHLSEGALTALARAIDAKSHWTAGHSERVTIMALALGRELGLDADGLELLHRGGLLHDIGKIGVPASILEKPGRLTSEERRIMQKHTTVGARILEPIRAYRDVIPMVLSHHERVDGAGYPDGLAGDEIHRHARIMAVADAYDALTSDRPYRKGQSPGVARGIIQEEAGHQFDPAVVRALFEVPEATINELQSIRGQPVLSMAGE